MLEYYLAALYNMFTQLYLQTTDPRTCMYNVLQENAGKIALSVIFHTVLYAVFFNLVSFIFQGKVLSSVINIRLFIILLVIMTLGNIARMHHVREIYHAYGENLEKAKKHIDKFFISWLFLG